MPPCNAIQLSMLNNFSFLLIVLSATEYLYEILIIVAYHDPQSVGETWRTVQHDEEPKRRDIVEITHSCLKQFYSRKYF